MAEEVGGVSQIEENSQNSPKNTEKEGIINSTSNSYAQYVSVDTSKEMNQFEENIEEMLTKLDEFLGLVDLIRADTNLCLNQTLPRIAAKGQEMEKAFQKIDRLEAFVGLVKEQMSLMEAAVIQAEEDLGSYSSIKRMFSSFSMPSFLSKKNPAKTTPQKPKLKYDPPTVFRTEDYLSAEGSSMSQTPSPYPNNTATKPEKSESASEEAAPPDDTQPSN